ncbi:MAG: hypothetical protein H0U12_01695, partial [Thermoleophilaceae bacterium]|nr:hypothetical protein [Thermoleophilaceae bacterium]
MPQPLGGDPDLLEAKRALAARMPEGVPQTGDLAGLARLEGLQVLGLEVSGALAHDR